MPIVSPIRKIDLPVFVRFVVLLTVSKYILAIIVAPEGVKKPLRVSEIVPTRVGDERDPDFGDRVVKNTGRIK
jgi:hypothetical protein